MPRQDESRDSTFDSGIHSMVGTRAGGGYHEGKDKYLNRTASMLVLGYLRISRGVVSCTKSEVLISSYKPVLSWMYISRVKMKKSLSMFNVFCAFFPMACVCQYANCVVIVGGIRDWDGER